MTFPTELLKTWHDVPFSLQHFTQGIAFHFISELCYRQSRQQSLQLPLFNTFSYDILFSLAFISAKLFKQNFLRYKFNSE